MQHPFSIEPLRALSRDHFGTNEFEVVEMPGGASLRRFFRVQTSGGMSAVGMFFPDALQSEEASRDAARTRWPFLEIQALLASRGVAVPSLLGEDTRAGWILVEDLGDVTLAEALLRSPERKRELYQTAVRDLARAQHALRELPHDCVVRSRAFDVELLQWEIEHFREWGVEGRGIAINPSQTERFNALARQLAERIRALPYGFVHRDYQSRNLMLHSDAAGANERLVWVDFQDALLGPRVYDLVALLGDSYQSFSDEFVSERLHEYCAFTSATQASTDEATVHEAELRREFDLVTVQRKLKDAGRFVFIQHKKGDASYLPFVEPTIALVQRALLRLTRDPKSSTPDVEIATGLATWLDDVLG